MKTFLMLTVTATDWFLFKINLKGNIMKSIAILNRYRICSIRFRRRTSQATPAPAATAVLQHQPRQKPRRKRKSLPKVSLQRKTHLKQTPNQPLLQRSKFDLDDSDLIIDDEVTLAVIDELVSLVS
jgi:hypothetical protein